MALQPLFAMIGIRLNTAAKYEATLAVRIAFKSAREWHRYAAWQSA